MQIFEELEARGLIAQTTDKEHLRDLFNNGKAVFYIGFDCTADSLTAGHFMALTMMKRLQMAGNRPIALIGGATTRPDVRICVPCLPGKISTIMPSALGGRWRSLLTLERVRQ